MAREFLLNGRVYRQQLVPSMVATTRSVMEVNWNYVQIASFYVLLFSSNININRSDV